MGSTITKQEGSSYSICHFFGNSDQNFTLLYLTVGAHVMPGLPSTSMTLTVAEHARLISRPGRKSFWRYLSWDRRVFRMYLGRDGRVFMWYLGRDGTVQKWTFLTYFYFDNVLLAHGNRDHVGHVRATG